MPSLGRWKMIDNLRRTLSAPFVLLSLVAGWTLPPAVAAMWTVFIVATIATAPMLPFVTGIIPRRRDISKRSHIRAVATDFVMGASQLAMLMILLAHQAWLMTDAIVRTLYRLFVSHRLMLEWTTAAKAKRMKRQDVRGFYATMAGGLALALATAAFVAWVGRGGGVIALPFVVLWILSPAIARWTSLPPPVEGTKALTPADTVALRLSARRTWRFFEQFVTAEDNMLPPDNYQEDPKPVLAHRTSPTNIGLYLLSIIAAHDFGWIGTHETVERLGATLDTMKRMELFRGHFYNWYGTRDLRPLDPKYVSSVDSGNLA
jgi:cyclic beta-1,2-glucan synthetase